MEQEKDGHVIYANAFDRSAACYVCRQAQKLVAVGCSKYLSSSTIANAIAFDYTLREAVL